MGCDDKELSVLITDDSQIAELNHQYRGKAEPTNVLSFPMSVEAEFSGDPKMLGDIVISADTAKRESDALGESLEHRIDRLLIHGLLHLLGHDHIHSDEEAEKMEEEERRLLALIMEA
ncbi:Endoribonuclease YbeY [uncultured Desulfobacterium sp.]|uniref:Endoribonuclease YbeY n=1 Tax=uncultured Desulfobacterium sp. TaxID=201089 RepID=A0A445N2M2_9BACT|nr:Endoribonuclease YbeY [uncultured Desulfobacterium sp.]